MKILTEKLMPGNFGWVEEGPKIKETLLDLALYYMRSELIELDSIEARSEVAWHIELLNNILDDLKECELAGNPNDPIKNKEVILPEDQEDLCYKCIKKEAVVGFLEDENSKKDKRIEELLKKIPEKGKIVMINP